MDNSSLVFHIPHASTVIPEDYLRGLLLTKQELEDELIWCTDKYCDELFDIGTGTQIVAPYSRLVCDVERFRNDEEEPGAIIGQGLLYTHTARGAPLRKSSVRLRNKVLEEIYDPHHARLEEAVSKALQKNQQCLIVDVHSYNTDAFNVTDLPDICIGADMFHTPKRLVTHIEDFFRNNGYSTAVNFPYEGTMVPQRWYHNDKKVHSVMIETNKRVYLKDDLTGKNENFDRYRSICKRLVNSILDELYVEGNDED